MANKTFNAIYGYPILSVGPTFLEKEDIAEIYESYDWLIYWYQYDEAKLEGTGFAVAKLADGTYDVQDLSHPCNSGPTEYWGSSQCARLRYDFVELFSRVTFEIPKEIEQQIRKQMKILEEIYDKAV